MNQGLLLRVFFVVFLGVMSVGLVAQAAPSEDVGAGSVESSDPIEPFNRVMWDVHNGIDSVVLRPVAMAYRTILPNPVRNSVRNFLLNLRTPVVLANDLLQFEFKRALNTTSRFVINSTVGVLGLFDVADSMGLPRHSEDFGQTLGSYGVGEGFYLVVPVLGPMNARDAVGRVVDFFLDPLNLYANNVDEEWVPITRAVVSGIDERTRSIELIDQLQRDSLDYYSAVRSIYHQRRVQEIANAEANTATE